MKIHRKWLKTMLKTMICCVTIFLFTTSFSHAIVRYDRGGGMCGGTASNGVITGNSWQTALHAMQEGIPAAAAQADDADSGKQAGRKAALRAAQLEQAPAEKRNTRRPARRAKTAGLRAEKREGDPTPEPGNYEYSGFFNSAPVFDAEKAMSGGGLSESVELYDLSLNVQVTDLSLPQQAGLPPITITRGYEPGAISFYNDEYTPPAYPVYCDWSEEIPDFEPDPSSRGLLYSEGLDPFGWPASDKSCMGIGWRLALDYHKGGNLLDGRIVDINGRVTSEGYQSGWFEEANPPRHGRYLITQEGVRYEYEALTNAGGAYCGLYLTKILSVDRCHQIRIEYVSSEHNAVLWRPDEIGEFFYSVRRMLPHRITDSFNRTVEFSYEARPCYTQEIAPDDPTPVQPPAESAWRSDLLTNITVRNDLGEELHRVDYTYQLTAPIRDTAFWEDSTIDRNTVNYLNPATGERFYVCQEHPHIVYWFNVLQQATHTRPSCAAETPATFGYDDFGLLNRIATPGGLVREYDWRAWESKEPYGWSLPDDTVFTIYPVYKLGVDEKRTYVNDDELISRVKYERRMVEEGPNAFFHVTYTWEDMEDNSVGSEGPPLNAYQFTYLRPLDSVRSATQTREHYVLERDAIHGDFDDYFGMLSRYRKEARTSYTYAEFGYDPDHSQVKKLFLEKTVNRVYDRADPSRYLATMTEQFAQAPLLCTRYGQVKGRMNYGAIEILNDDMDHFRFNDVGNDSTADYVTYAWEQTDGAGNSFYPAFQERHVIAPVAEGFLFDLAANQLARSANTYYADPALPSFGKTHESKVWNRNPDNGRDEWWTTTQEIWPDCYGAKEYWWRTKYGDHSIDLMNDYGVLSEANPANVDWYYKNEIDELGNVRAKYMQKKSNGAQWAYCAYAYDDSLLRLTQTIPDGAYRSQMTYHDEAREVEVSRGDQYARHEYDSAGKLQRSLTRGYNGANMVGFSVDDQNNVLGVTEKVQGARWENAAADVLTTIYDGLGRPVEARDSANHTRRYAYHICPDGHPADGYQEKWVQVSEFTNEAGICTVTATDAGGRTVFVCVDYTEDPAAGANVLTRSQYDVQGRLTSVTRVGHRLAGQPGYPALLNQTHTYAYDNLGRCYRQTSPESGTVQRYYRNGSNPNLVTRVVTAEGETTFAYNDPLFRLTQVISWDGSRVEYGYEESEVEVAPGQFIALEYSAGQLTSTRQFDAPSAVYPLQQLTLNSHDAQGRIIKEYQYVGSLTDQHLVFLGATSQGFDSYGNVNRIEYPASGVVVNYAYANNGYLSDIYVYDNPEWSLMKGIKFGPAGLTDMNYNQPRGGNHFDYDSKNRLYQATMGSGELNFRYHYDAGGRLSQIQDVVLPHFNQDFVYDGLNRLIEARTFPAAPDPLGQGPAYATTYFGYDGAGNMTERGLSPETCYASYNPANNQILSLDGFSDFQYDLAGQLIRNPLRGQLYTYNARGQLTQVNIPEDQLSIHYGYAAGGERLFEIDFSDGSYRNSAYARRLAREAFLGTLKTGTKSLSNNTGNNPMAFLFGKNSPPRSAPAKQESSAMNWSEAEKSLVSCRVYYRGIDGRSLEMTDNTGRHQIFLYGPKGLFLRVDLDVAKGYYYYNDHLGSPLMLARENGNKHFPLQTRRYQVYVPFGEETILPDPETKQGYTGYLQDDTGLNYCGARYYDPLLARFLSPDPAGLNGGYWNLYAYCANNPISYVDPEGKTVHVFDYLSEGQLVPASQVNNDNFLAAANGLAANGMFGSGLLKAALASDFDLTVVFLDCVENPRPRSAFGPGGRNQLWLASQKSIFMTEENYEEGVKDGDYVKDRKLHSSIVLGHELGHLIYGIYDEGVNIELVENPVRKAMFQAERTGNAGFPLPFVGIPNESVNTMMTWVNFCVSLSSPSYFSEIPFQLQKVSQRLVEYNKLLRQTEEDMQR